MSVALLAVAVVAATGWALQAAALPPPKPAARVAADASRWLQEYRFVIDEFHLDHRRVEGACLRGWLGRAQGPHTRGSLLSLQPGTVLRAPARGRVTIVRGAADRLIPARLAAAAGCTGKLEAALVTAAQRGTHLTAKRAYAAGRPAVALEWSRGRGRSETLYVSPRTDRPLAVVLELPHGDATAHLLLARARPRLLERFHLPVSRPGQRTER